TYTKPMANTLIEDLIAWHLFCQEKRLRNQQNQIYNNLRSINLLYTAGMSTNLPSDTEGMLTAWGNHAGKRALIKMLEQQNLADAPRYRAIANKINNNR
ncbi:MAG: hypothetical protein AAFV53_42335, partial [Myxococcota bacterium]